MEKTILNTMVLPQSGGKNIGGNIKIGSSKIIKKPLNLKKVKPLVKKAHELGIKVHAFCVCGLPGETIEQMWDTYNFVKDSGMDSASFFVAAAIKI